MNARAADCAIAVVINDAAHGGHPADTAAAIEASFRAAGAPVQVVPASGDALRAPVERALRGGARTIVAGGGDGTLNTVAAMLVDSDVTLGVLPLGTLNHFAKDLGIPLDLDRAVRAIVAGHVRRVDVGDVNGRIFLNNSSLGLYPDIVRFREQQRARLGIGKWAALAWATLRALRRNATLSVAVETGAQTLSCRTPFAFIGNNEYVLEGVGLGAREALDAGVLSLYTAQTGDRFAVVRLMLRALTGRLRGAAEFNTLAASRIVIETAHRHLSVATDGEVAMLATPLRYRSRPGALRVLVPLDDTAGG